MITTIENTWTKTNDYYNREVVTCDVYSRPVKRASGRTGMLYVMDKDNFTYTCSMGANSDYSYTGCFYGCPKITNVNEAMEAIDKIVNLQLSNRDKEARKFIESLK